MEKIATDISTFENLRKGGYVYVDKTDMLWRLVANQVGRQCNVGICEYENEKVRE